MRGHAVNTVTAEEHLLGLIRPDAKRSAFTIQHVIEFPIAFIKHLPDNIIIKFTHTYYGDSP